MWVDAGELVESRNYVVAKLEVGAETVLAQGIPAGGDPILTKMPLQTLEKHWQKFSYYFG